MSDFEQFELHGGDTSVVTPAQWQSRVQELTQMLTEAGLTADQVADDLREAFGAITFRDSDGLAWRHDGAVWWHWNLTTWEQRLPPPQLRLDKVAFDVPTD